MPDSGEAGPEPVALDVQLESIRTMLASGQRPPAGQLLGLPELDGDMWADMAGAVAITGAPARTITGWLNRRGPKRCPFPEPRRSLYRLYWPVSVLQAWLEQYSERVGQGATERVSA